MQCSYLRGSPAADQRRTQGEGPKTRRAVGNGDREAREHEAGRCGSGLAGGLASAGACDQLAPPTCSETALPSRFAGQACASCEEPGGAHAARKTPHARVWGSATGRQQVEAGTQRGSSGKRWSWKVAGGSGGDKQ